MVATEFLTCGCPRAGHTTRKVGAYLVSRSTYLPSCALGTHTHTEDRIVLTLRGKFNSVYRGRTFALDDLRAIYRPAEIEHRDAYAQETVCVSIRLPAGEPERSEAFTLCDGDLPAIADSLCAELDASDSASSLAIESLSAQIAARLCSSQERDDGSSRWIRAVRDWIEEQYAHPPTLQAIAVAVDRDVSHVASVFRRTYGKTIGDYVRDVRVWRTRKLVEDSSVPLAEVAQRGGFSDQSHFGRLFKQRFAMTPGEYRRRVAGR
jgi:AraC family transcriptional regulator